MRLDVNHCPAVNSLVKLRIKSFVKRRERNAGRHVMHSLSIYIYVTIGLGALSNAESLWIRAFLHFNSSLAGAALATLSCCTPEPKPAFKEGGQSLIKLLHKQKSNKFPTFLRQRFPSSHFFIEIFAMVVVGRNRQ